jgi:hypothetical protein
MNTGQFFTLKKTGQFSACAMLHLP